MEIIQVSLIDKNGNVQYGLNWGHRNNRDRDESYLQLEPEVYKGDFFPTKGKYFIVDTDDKKTIIFTRAQKEYGCALQTPENNSVLGKYIRERLGLVSGAEITVADIEKSGINSLFFLKIDHMHYHMSTTQDTLLQFTKKCNFNIGTKRTNDPLQQIFFGAPGTGKSFKINEVCAQYENYRTTFHPDTDYASFVGSYKPITKSVVRYDIYSKPIKDENGDDICEDRIVYRYVFQSFLKAYIAAWKEQQKAEPQPVFLVIEEINRGNCAQIFGDIFQLLDRNETGYSDYPIVADDDLAQELKREFEHLAVANPEAINALYKGGKDVVGSVKDGSRLLLPNNLYIWATMNTSDQSLFPIDSAFKRRWDWKYIKIKDNAKDYKIVFTNGNVYDWWGFVEAINDKIENGEIQQEDKKLGYFFAKSKEGKITAERFLSKVMFYLYNDVFKDFGFDEDFFKGADGKPMTFASYFDEMGEANEEQIERFLNNLGLEPIAFEQESEDKDDDKPVKSGIHARVNGTKVWSITYALYQILRAVAHNYTYPELVDLINRYVHREDEIIKTIPSAEGYQKEKRWYNYKPLSTSDGQTFVITNQWKKGFIPQLKELAASLGVSFIDDEG